ncbi:hypothetical protein [Cognataquiflexum aquatile]|uniref:hypothetical protein n=1 Tax=Cognataquiflexum aquatile TaxID=2249427 RepID=UPI000DEB6222|nr:hypothetical protein [Cognataquiflexum aquatile]
MKSISHIDMAEFGVSKFAKTEVLPDTAQKDERKFQLLRAMLLHFIEHQTVKVCIKNEKDEIFSIECSVIAVTDEHLMLKSGLVIPIKAICSIELV